MFSFSQLLAHLVGDYLLQSHWMATEKTKAWLPALAHALVYSLPFVLFLQPSFLAWAVIVGTHVLIDHYRLARYVAYAKNWLGPKRTWERWADCSATGFSAATPVWLSTWLMIIIDNTMHLLINGAALAWL